MTPCADCGSTAARDHAHVCENCLRSRQRLVEECRSAQAPFMPHRRTPSGYAWQSDPDPTLFNRARARAEAHIRAALAGQ